MKKQLMSIKFFLKHFREQLFEGKKTFADKCIFLINSLTIFI